MAKLKFPDRKRPLKTKGKEKEGSIIRKRTLYIWATGLLLGIIVNVVFINAEGVSLFDRIWAGAILGAIPTAFLLWILRDIEKSKDD